MNAIEAHGTYKVFGKRPETGVARLKAGATRDELREDGLTAAVIDASFDVREGEIFVVMGLSGSGKSTLIRMVNGLWAPTAGELLVYGDDIVKMDDKQLRAARRDKVSMVFQHFALLPHRTVGENAAYGLQLKGLNRSERELRAKDALALVGLKGWEASLPGQLSGGMRQRVGLARALAAGTDIMLMDEAFSALDPLIKREMQDQLVELQKKLGKTILFITHDLNEAMRLGDRIAMMRDGRIVQNGTAEEILNSPANGFVEQFVQDVDRTRVLTARSVMTTPPGGGRAVGEVVDGGAVCVNAETRLSDVINISAGCEEELVVIDDKRRLVGVLSRTTLLGALRHSDVDGTASIRPSTVGQATESALAGTEVNSL